MHIPRGWIVTKAIGTCFVFIAALAFSSMVASASDAQQIEHVNAPEQEAGASAVVYVIDKSSSMLWIFDELRDNLKEVAQESRQGDCFSIILFGDSVTTLVSYRSMDEFKRETAIKLLDSVHPDSFYTNLKLAIRRGTESLHTYFLDGVAEDYTLVLVTDGKNNPSPGSFEDYTIEEALTQFPDFTPGKQWSLRYIALQSQIDAELLAAVEKYGESFIDAEKIASLSETTQQEVVGSVIENPFVWEAFGVRVVDQAGRVKVKRIREEAWTPLPKGSKERFYSGDRIAVEPESKAAISFGDFGRLGLKENTEIQIGNLQKPPLGKSATIKLKLEAGTVWNAVEAPKGGLLNYEVLTPIAVTAIRGTVLRVAFEEEAQKQSIAVVEGRVETRSAEEQPSFEKFELAEGKYSEILPGRQPSPPIPIPAEILLDWGRWMKALIWKNPFSRINFETVRVTPGKGQIEMGPMKPNKRFSQYIPLKFSQEYFGREPITAEAAIDLPPGVRIKVEIRNIEDKKLMKNIFVTLECTPYLRYAGAEAYRGHIQLKCLDPDIKFSKNRIDLNIIHYRPSLFSLVRTLSPRVKALLATVGAFLCFVGLVMTWVYRKTLLRWKMKAVAYLRDKLVKTKLLHLFRARPSGQIILRNAPFRTDKMIFDLAALSRRSNQVTLGIGADASNAIVLPHPSIRPAHCSIWASRQRNPTQIFIESCSDGHLAINGEKKEGLLQLADKDMIEIGECQFQFVDSQFYHQVKVLMEDETVYVGKLEFWDLSQTVFYMTETSEKDDFIPIRFADVCYVDFYKDESERHVDILPYRRRDSKEKKRKAVALTLTNNKKLRGYVDKKYKHQKSTTGVFLYPASGSSNIQYTYIPRSSVETIVIVNPHQDR